MNYYTVQIDQNESINKKYKSIGITSNYIGYLLILASAFTGCVSVSALASWICIPTGIRSSEVELNIFAINAGIKKDNCITNRMRTKNVKKYF